MIAHHYIYFRDGMSKGWQSLGLHKLALHSLRSAGGGDEDGGTSQGNKGRVCSHCKTGLHPGNKGSCPWKDSTPKEAREAGLATLKNLGKDLDG